MNNKILLISTSFSPENAIGSIRLTKFVKYLIKLNYKVTVISPTLHEGSRIDLSLECDELKKSNRILISQSKVFNKMFLSKRNQVINSNSASQLIKNKKNKNIIVFFKTELFRLIQYLYTMIRNLDWKVQVKKYLNSNYEKGNFDIVISSYPSLGGPWASIYAKKKGIAKKFIVDFRDPINYEANSNFYKTFFNTKIQKRIILNADKVTYISNGIAKKFGKVNKDKLVFLPNGFDNSDFIDIPNKIKTTIDNKLILSYVGSLYGGERDLSIVFKVLRELINNNKLDINNIMIIYAGKEFSVLKHQASKYKLSSVLNNKGFISRKEAIDIQANSDIILVSSWNTEKDQGILSGKVYECFLTKKTILAVINGTKPESELAEMIKKVNGGFTIEEASLNFKEDYFKLTDFLLNSYLEKINTHKLSSKYNSNLEFYSYKNIVDRLHNLIIKMT